MSAYFNWIGRPTGISLHAVRLIPVVSFSALFSLISLIPVAKSHTRTARPPGAAITTAMPLIEGTKVTSKIYVSNNMFPIIPRQETNF